MAITKILARSARIDRIIQYVLNGDKTDGQILTAHQNCDPGRECRQMLDTKREIGTYFCWEVQASKNQIGGGLLRADS